MGQARPDQAPVQEHRDRLPRLRRRPCPQARRAARPGDLREAHRGRADGGGRAARLLPRAAGRPAHRAGAEGDRQRRGQVPVAREQEAARGAAGDRRGRLEADRGAECPRDRRLQDVGVGDHERSQGQDDGRRRVRPAARLALPRRHDGWPAHRRQGLAGRPPGARQGHAPGRHGSFSERVVPAPWATSRLGIVWPPPMGRPHRSTASFRRACVRCIA